jgi:UDP:flavonoid glycosyltransferase YjiC (YdhE family)
MVPLARAFVALGDEVMWAIGSVAAARIKGEGFPAAACGLSEEAGMMEFRERFPELHSLPRPEWPDFMFPRLFGAVRAPQMLAELLPVAKEWRPELVVNDAAEFAGPIAAAAVGVPSITHAFGPLLPEARVAAAGEEVAQLWTEQGMSPRPYGGSYDHLYLDLYPPSLQPQERPQVPVTQLLRPDAFAIAGDEPLPEWLTEHSATPLLYVTLGTVFSNDDVLSMIVKGVRELPVRVVVTVGPNGDPASLGPQPSNVHIARYIPQDQLLAHCAAVVSHGGSGTFLATLAAGLPQLCLPQAADQFLNAAACARAGIGLAIEPGAVSVEHVRTAAERLLSDDTFRTAARRGSEDIAAMPTAREVADRLHRDYG